MHETAEPDQSPVISPPTTLPELPGRILVLLDAARGPVTAFPGSAITWGSRADLDVGWHPTRCHKIELPHHWAGPARTWPGHPAYRDGGSRNLDWSPLCAYRARRVVAA